MLRYDQVHRVASGPLSDFPPPYRAMVDENGRLPSDPWKRVPGFKRPRWNRLAYIAYAGEDDIDATLGQEKFAECIIADEQTAFRMVTREITREYIRIPSERHRDPISLDPEGSRIDAVSILSFACMNDVGDNLVPADHAAIQESEDALAGGGSEWWTAVNHSVINRLTPEITTRRS